jgi:hypothetical protein
MLNNPNNAAINLLAATVNELKQAAANAVNRLKGQPAAGNTPAVTTGHIEEEADPVTWSSIQLMITAAAATDGAKINAALAALQ